jgi:hypothetical protein
MGYFGPGWGRGGKGSIWLPTDWVALRGDRAEFDPQKGGGLRSP